MKLRFESDLDYQLAAIESVCDLFRGQETSRTEFTVVRPVAAGTGALALESDLGVGNRLALLDSEILENLRAVQLRNGLVRSDALVSGDFTVEMETGTGKTYVYLRTAFELHRRYGFTKFVIVVPSVAIREGVRKSIEMTRDHFGALYANTPFDSFVYDSARLGQVRNFATSSTLQLMIVTIASIYKNKATVLHQDREQTGGEKPIDLIRATRPVVIVDEPQSVDGKTDGAGTEALEALRALCTLRYSATHIRKHHMVYRLDAIEAYQKGLVKQIEVAGATIENAFNKPYVRFLGIERKGKVPIARVEIDVAGVSGAVKRIEKTVHSGEQLDQATGRPIYDGMTIGEISAVKTREYVEIQWQGRSEFLGIDKAIGDVEAGAVAREMIRRTIYEHLDKERRLRPRGIKVLSLFFIDRVAKYRQYSGVGHTRGIYAAIFEEEYARAAKHPEYQSLFGEIDLSRAAAEVHGGYFAEDKSKKGTWQELELNGEGEIRNQDGRDAAERAYDLIMRDKERLLDLAEPLKFIFSHSALREGWDNPNVFQICTLREMRTERQRRQTIGRGLRLCVDSRGERNREAAVNILTVVANESYEEFARNLQTEMEEETGVRFGVVDPVHFATIVVTDSSGARTALGADRSARLCEQLRSSGMIDSSGRVTDKLRSALKDGTLEIPGEFAEQRAVVIAALKKVAGGLDIRDREARVNVTVRNEVLESPEFRALWERICRQTRYRVKLDPVKLQAACITAMREFPKITRPQMHWRKGSMQIGAAGVETTEMPGAASAAIPEPDVILPDLLTALQDRTQLTRATIYRILVASGRLDEFNVNPQRFIELATVAIKGTTELMMSEGAWYETLGEKDAYSIEDFRKVPIAYLGRMIDGVPHSVYDPLTYDSETEATFVRDLENRKGVRAYVKLPDWFKIPTPLGSYNPDWAMVVNSDDGTKAYLVVETKGVSSMHELRPEETAKIKYAHAHFAALGVGEPPLAQYRVARTVDEVLSA